RTFVALPNPELVYTSNSELGIGVSTPTANLHVAGSVRFENIVGAPEALLQVDNSGVVSTTDPTNVGNWTRDGNDIHYSAGLVGIGNTSPAKALDILTDQTGNAFRMMSSALPDDTPFGFQFGRGDTPHESAEIRFTARGANDPNSFISFGTWSNASAMTLHGTGSMALGLNGGSPDARLHVRGGSIRVDDPTNPVLELEHGNTGDLNYIFSDDDQHLNIRTDDAAQDVLLQTGGTQGNVGIGKAVPGAKLDVLGDVRVNDNPIWLRSGTDTNHGLRYASNFDGEVMDGPVLFGHTGGALGTENTGENAALRWDENARVGINTTTSTDGQLHINGNIAFQRGSNAVIGFPVAYAGNTGTITIQARNAINSGGCHWGSDLNLFAGHRNSDGVNCAGGGVVRIRAGGNTFSTQGEGVITFETQEGTTPIERMRITDLGRVGIGTNAPEFRFDVRGGAVTRNYAYGFLNSSNPTGTCGSCDGDFTAHFENRVVAEEFNAISDARIKQIDARIEPLTALNQLMQVQPTAYRYVDFVTRGSEVKYGVIAQEVEETLPNIVSQSKNWVPNIFQFGKIEAVDSIEAGQIVFLKLKMDSLNVDAAVGDTIQIVTTTGKAQAVVHGVFKDGSITFTHWEGPALQPDEARVFVFGKRVNDFRSVDYDQIFTLNVAATQAQQQLIEAQQREIEQLKQEKSSLEQRLERIETYLDLAAQPELSDDAIDTAPSSDLPAEPSAQLLPSTD
ncbi:MAG: tail fiber domain-containing protein, partial [Bacteroidota bacterium]